MFYYISFKPDLVDKIATEHEKTYVKDHPRDLIDCFLENMKTGKDYFTVICLNENAGTYYIYLTSNM